MGICSPFKVTIWTANVAHVETEVNNMKKDTHEPSPCMAQFEGI